MLLKTYLDALEGDKLESSLLSKGEQHPGDSHNAALASGCPAPRATHSLDRATLCLTD